MQKLCSGAPKPSSRVSQSVFTQLLPRVCGTEPTRNASHLRPCGAVKEKPLGPLAWRDVRAPCLTKSKSGQGRDATLAELRQQDGACRS